MRSGLVNSFQSPTYAQSFVQTSLKSVVQSMMDSVNARLPNSWSLRLDSDLMTCSESRELSGFRVGVILLRWILFETFDITRDACTHTPNRGHTYAYGTRTPTLTGTYVRTYIEA